MASQLPIRKSSVRLTPLAACLAVALAAGTASTLADAATLRNGHQIPANRTHHTYVHGAALPTHAQRVAKAQSLIQAARAAHPHAAPVPGHVAGAGVVTNCNDAGPGSFRDVVAAAVSGDTVDMSALGCSTITLTSGAVSTGVDDLTILGPGQSALTIDANNNDRAIAHYGYGTLSISNVTIANGAYYYYNNTFGGCVTSNGNVTLDQSTVTGCDISSYYNAFGGGIGAAYDVTLTNSTVTNSQVSYGYGFASGGGVASLGGVVNLVNSTISGNSTYGNAGVFVQGGGAYTFGGDLTSTGSTFSGNYSYAVGGGLSGWYGTVGITNSTITGNYAVGAGGGISTFSSVLRINNSTIDNNTSGYYGGGIYDNSGGSGTTGQTGAPTGIPPVTFNSTIIFGNTAAGSANDTNAYPPLAAVGANNLIGSSDGTLTSPGDTISSDPLLQALANNGGPTMTQALAAGSPAIDAGNNVAGLSFDQRGTGFLVPTALRPTSVPMRRVVRYRRRHNLTCTHPFRPCLPGHSA